MGNPVKSTIVLLCIILCITQYLCSSALGENKSGLKPQVISLPTGAGSVEGLGESFEPQLNSGTGTYSVKISVPPGVNGHQPNISLGYNSGQGKGPFGIGWALNIPYIQRQTDKGLPRYDEGDTFIYSDGEELIPIGNNVYRSENEETFIRFERIGDYWEARDRSGILYRFGATASSRVESEDKVFKWCLKEKIDTNGNIITYQYFRDSLQIYLSQIQYSKVDEENFNLLEFQYEERTDCFSDYRSTFEIKTAKRCSTIKVCSQGSLVRKYVLSYKAGSSFSLLAKITQVGDDNSGTLTELTFGYSELQTNIASVISMDSPPSYSLLRDDTEIIDLNGDSLPDIIHTESGNHQYYLNEGNNKWGSKQYVTESPLANLSKDGTQLADIDGDGLADLLDWRGSSPTTYRYYPNHGENWWGDSVFFANNPSFDFEDVNIELVDINNDKIIDVMHTGSSSYHYYINNGDGSWNEESYWSPALEGHRFADPNFRLADMNGDRMLDLVYIHRTSTIATINYWPNMGYGHWDSKVTMSGPLLVGSTQGALLLTDVNSDGLSDLVAVKSRKVTYWINLGNDTWRDTYEILDTPLYDHSKTTIRIADMNGNGSKDILWDTYPAYSYQRLRYLDFVGETRPNLLTTIDNGLGKKTEIEYQPSTYYFLTARENGEPWQTKPPFPVHVVSRVTVIDGLGGTYITAYVYRDGYYDGKEKEFRGFAYVEKIEQGDSSAPTTVTKLWFNTGREIECLKGKELKREIASDTGTLYRSEENRWDSRVLYTETNGRAVTFSFIDRKDAFLFEGTSSPIQIQQEFDYDAFGNLIKDLDYGQVVDGDRSVGNDELLTCKEYAVNETRWIVDRVSREMKTDLTGNFVSESRYYYDGDPFTGLPLGMVEKGNLTRQEDSLGPLEGNRFISIVRKQYDSYGNTIGIKDGNNNLRTIIYDPIFHTFPIEETIHLGEGNTLSITANYHLGFGKVIDSADFNGNLTQYTYDTFGRLKKIIKPGDVLSLPTLEYSYNLGNPISSILTKTRERSGEEHTYETVTYFDGLSRKRQTIEEAEHGRYIVKQAKEFNSRGTERAVFLPYFALSFGYETPNPDKPKISTFYDPAGRVIKKVNPDSSFSSTVYLPLQQMLYDEEDNRLDSSHANTPFTNSYDGRNRLVQVEEINQNERYVTSYHYDPLGNLTQINDAQGNIKTMVYDALGRKLEMNDPDSGRKVYEYDDAGNLIKTTDNKDQIIQYSYDGANRILSEDYLNEAGITPDVAYHYDASSQDYPDTVNVKGALSWVEDLPGAQFFSYDERGNTLWTIKRVSDQGAYNDYKTAMTYDAMDRVVSMTHPDGDKISYSYDNRTLLESIPGFVDGMDYHASGQIVSIDYANGIETSYSYDPRQRLINLNTKNIPQGNEVVQDLSYTLDGVSNITAIADGRGLPPDSPKNAGQIFEYDNLYRLTQADGPGYGRINFQYDKIGNMIWKKSPDAPDPKHIDDALINLGNMDYGGAGGSSNRSGKSPGDPPGPHAVTSTESGLLYDYDDNGNMISHASGDVYSWDFRDRLIKVQKGDVDTQYVYDYGGQRVIKKVNDGGEKKTTFYINEGYEVREGKAIKYVFAGSRRVARVEGRLPGNGESTYQTLTFHPGWNFFSLEVEPENTAIGKVLGSIEGDFSEVWTFDALQNEYKGYVPNEGVDDLTEIHAQKGYLVNIVSPTTLLVSGVRNTNNVNMAAGWNLVGCPANADLPIEEALASINGKFGSAWSFETVDGKWKYFDPERPAFLNDLLSMEPGKAYWVEMITDSQLAYMEKPAKIFFYHPDHLGSSNAITDLDGVVVERTEFYPYGRPRYDERNTFDSAYKYTGKEFDKESALMYYGARYYEPVVGKFVSVDPLYAEVDALEKKTFEEFLLNPQQVNIYIYCLNNSVTLVDPSGSNPVVPALFLGAGYGLLNRAAFDIGYNMTDPAKGFQFSSWRSYVASTIGGMATGGAALFVTKNPLLACAIGGGTASVAEMLLDNINIDTTKIAIYLSIGDFSSALSVYNEFQRNKSFNFSDVLNSGASDTFFSYVSHRFSKGFSRNLSPYVSLELGIIKGLDDTIVENQWTFSDLNPFMK